MNKKAQSRTIPIIRKNKAMKNKLQPIIKERLKKLNTNQFKIFYAMIVYCRAHQKSFISTQNLLTFGANSINSVINSTTASPTHTTTISCSKTSV